VTAGALTAFDRGTAVTPLGDGAWAATCDPAWWVTRGPNGGYLAAIVLRAMTAELDDPARDPRSLTCHYLRPPGEGPMRIEVAIERSGRSASTLIARLLQGGRLCVLAVAAFARDVPGPAEYAAAPPQVPAPEEVAPVSNELGLAMVENFELRPALGEPPFAGPQAGDARTGGWIRFAEPRPLDAAALAMYSDAWMPSPWVVLAEPVAAPTLDLTVHFRAPRAAAAVGPAEPVLAEFRSTTAAGGFFEEDARLWSREGVLLAHSRQLALLTAPGAATP
jgi:acyl-CoA thioesterase